MEIDTSSRSMKFRTFFCHVDSIIATLKSSIFSSVLSYTFNIEMETSGNKACNSYLDSFLSQIVKVHVMEKVHASSPAPDLSPIY